MTPLRGDKVLNLARLQMYIVTYLKEEDEELRLLMANLGG